MIRYVENTPTLDEYKTLRDSVDWNLKEKGITDERALESLVSAPYCVCAYDDENIVGMVRISGDSGMYGYIQDTIVIPNYQGKGIGKKMMEILLGKIKEKKGYLIGVCPSKVSVDFYKGLGFKKRPENPNGFMFMEID